MNVYVNSITGIDDALVSMLMSKRSWMREKESEIRELCSNVLFRNGKINPDAKKDDLDVYSRHVNALVKWGCKHITLLRFIDISATVEGLHRGGQDDWDSHAMRFNNRIVRSSTRLSKFGYEMSDFYKGKIIPTDIALAEIGIETPNRVEHDGKVYVKTVNGYIREDMKDNQDVKRGLYFLAIPSNFVFKINLTEWAHVYKERNKDSGANPEVKECCEEIASQIEQFQPLFNRELFGNIRN